MTIREFLKKNKLLTDGAMGTYFDKNYHGEFRYSEAANVADPEAVEKIHHAYIQSGSRLIRSNTFSCNRFTLQALKQEDSVTFAEVTLKDLICRGYHIAQKCASFSKEAPVYVAADIGPVPEDPSRSKEDVMLEYMEICDAFLEEKADIFVLETFPDERDVLKIAAYIKKKRPHAFILAQFSFSNTGFGSTGYHYKSVLSKASESQWIDAVGMNCSMGAIHMKKCLKVIQEQNIIKNEKYLSALPNSGYPKIVRGRAVYADAPSYFGDKVRDLALMGASIIGGCCGTTPACIGQVNALLQGKDKTAGYFPKRPVSIRDREDNSQIKNKREDLFREKLERGEKVFAVELDPPFDTNIEKLMEGAGILKNTRADIITLADSPLARSRTDSMMLAGYLHSKEDVLVMPHVACRDRNRISMRGALLGAHIQGIRDLLIVTGDPVGPADKGNTKGVFDYNSIKFMQALSVMNQELFAEDPFFYGGALNQNGANPEAIAKRMRMKMEAGCSYFLTQPVYSKQDIDRIAWLKEETGARILIGIMPLVSYKNALFIKNEMPGIEVPDEILAQYKPEGNRRQWEEIAVRISLDIIEAAKDVGAGYYFMTPFNRVSLIQTILEKVKES